MPVRAVCKPHSPDLKKRRSSAVAFGVPCKSARLPRRNPGFETRSKQERVVVVWTREGLLHIYMQYYIYLFAHLTVLHFSLIYCTFYFFIYFFTYIYALVWCYFYIIFYSLHCPLSGPDLTYISLLIIPCIIYYVTNKETLNLEP